MDLALHAFLVVAIAGLLWVATSVTLDQFAAASGNGQPGVIVIEHLREARGSDIPVGTFTEPDGTVTHWIAWQGPAAVGDRLEGVRVGDRAWPKGVQVGLGNLLLLGAIVVALAWRVLALVTAWRKPPDPEPFDMTTYRGAGGGLAG